MPPATLSWRPADGGLYLWCRLLAPGLDSFGLQREAADAGVSFVTGHPFYADGGGERHLRLCYTRLPPADIGRGIKLLAGLFEEKFGPKPSGISASRPLV